MEKKEEEGERKNKKKWGFGGREEKKLKKWEKYEIEEKVKKRTD